MSLFLEFMVLACGLGARMVDLRLCGFSSGISSYLRKAALEDLHACPRRAASTIAQVGGPQVSRLLP
eukprot:CAMPEP_0195031670 /NCGR_PEP_ID=MMETSP0326_2-20130528/61733_1 /TAXON_ID=2866 ORGANISM="Crypthecodinium cohnii, Strain Seligo" /NCGR_SAMPLE_ID=MMETSP0326_2 /ASSEMBLY_ACC=CAM_ASM_000348 /LENGTH=66 /DNA_ID=CAMNT_0040055481 /DNA_START=91 /DNA_END=291 /DNA_ORIENTATION=+